MFFEKVEEILEIARKKDTSIFVVPEGMEVKIPKAIVLEPKEKMVITIEQVREVISRIELRQTEDLFIVIRPVEKLSEEAANAFLKNLEEPKEKVHFILIAKSLNEILPTILSRAGIYILREKGDKFREIGADEKTKEMAKKMMTCGVRELVSFADEIIKKKEGARERAMKITEVAIEMSYKTYVLTKKEVFLEKIPKLIELYENLEKNGNVKLQIVACLS